MKTRIISGVSYSLIIIAVMFFMNTAALPILMAFICGVAVYELNHVAKVKLPLAIPSIIVGAYIPIEIRYHFLEKIHVTPFAAIAVYIIAMLIMMVKWHSKVKFEQVAISVLCSIAVPESLGCWIRINDLRLVDERYTQANVVYLILFTLFCAWLTDMFAYFTGVFFGKHKMTPVVSPKKTWEGAIGGVVLTAADFDVSMIDDVYVAGGIGSGINMQNAVNIGMFPDVPLEKFHYIGNSSLTGAYLMLHSTPAEKKTYELASNMTYLELSTVPTYMDEFVGACFIPHTDTNLFPSVMEEQQKR